jgi:outer membrane receptor protein involved in Fe transport
LYWQHHSQRWNTIAGADFDDTHGISNDYSYNTQMLTRSGGTLLAHGLFGQGDMSFGPARLFAGIRHQFTGLRGETFVSPNGGIVVGLKQFRLRAAGYRSFRSPTLNELYRSFRVGNALTLANPELVPEGLVGVEAGLDWNSESSSIAFTMFRNELNNLVDNATISITPRLILRQRQNFPSALSRGFEFNANHRWQHWRAEAGYMFADARLASGQRIPEVPKHQGTGQIIFSAGKTLIAGGIRSYSLVFDDDLNEFKLPGYAALQISAQQRLTDRLTAIVSVDNLLDRTYLVALTPYPNTGSPRLWRVGVRWSGSIK